MADGGRTDDAPPHTQSKDLLQVGHRADAAPQLHLQTGVLGYRLHDSAITPLSAPGAVQIHHVNVAGACVIKGLCGGKRIIRHLVSRCEISFVKADSLTIFQVNGGK